MAKLWGTGASGTEDKPNWLTPAQKDRCYATAAGWMLMHNNGIEELLVSIRGLSLVGKLGVASIANLEWGAATMKELGPGTIKIVFNEAVQITGSPQITITHGGGTVVGTYASINSTNTALTFNFTIPAVANSPMSVAAQTVALNGGTILEKVAPNAAADLVLTAHVAASITNPTGRRAIAASKAITAAATVTAAAFSTGTYTAGTTKQVTLTYSGPVDVTLTPTLIVHGTVTANTTASYASGTGTNTIVYNFTVPSAGQTLSLLTQSIAGTGTVKEAGSATQPASPVISSAVATAAGTKTTV